MKGWSDVLKKENLVVLLLAGILLLVIAMPVKEKEGEETEEQTKKQETVTVGSDTCVWQEQQQERLQNMLMEAEGVGKTHVFITFENSGEILVEKDGEETVFEKDAKGNQTPWIAQEKYPKVSGVLVIAQGGDSPTVVQNIQEAVQALFQVEAHKIKVMKMK
ncbi:MAG: stage III sporulation protein AG [Blautia sp.]